MVLIAKSSVGTFCTCAHEKVKLARTVYRWGVSPMLISVSASVVRLGTNDDCGATRYTRLATVIHKKRSEGLL